jgi:hypothetical protein
MKILKIIVGILLLLAILFVVAIVIVGAHLGDIVKAGLEKVGPKVTQTTLTVDAVNVSLLAGTAGVRGLVLGNPEGFKAPQSISVSNAAISLVPGSVLSDKVVIRSIEVRAPEITFEGNPFGANNLTKIKDNVHATTGSTPNAASPPAASPANQTTAPATPAAPASPARPAKKFQVDDFLITGAIVHANITGLNQQLTLPMPEIHLTDLGKGTDGITAADLTQKIISEITTKTIQTLASNATNLGKNAVNAAENAAMDAASNALKNTGLNTTNAVNKLKKGLDGLLGK